MDSQFYSNSDHKVRLATADSVDSNNSGNYMRVNLNNQFSPLASSVPFFPFDEGYI